MMQMTGRNTSESLRRWRECELRYAELVRRHLQATATSAVTAEFARDVESAREEADHARMRYFEELRA